MTGPPTLLGYDSTNVEAIPPAGFGYLLAYIDGAVTSGNFAAMRARFPTARILKVTTVGTPGADLCDVEPGNIQMGPAVAGYWAGEWRAIYSSTGNPPPTDVPWFAADPTGVPHLYPGANVVGTQWAWPDFGSPGDYDISWALPSWVNPQPRLEDLLSVSIAVDANGSPHIAGPNPAGHLLYFKVDPTDPSGWSVTDITAKIADAYPGTVETLATP